VLLRNLTKTIEDSRKKRQLLVDKSRAFRLTVYEGGLSKTGLWPLEGSAVGHQHLENLPRSKHWVTVVSLIAGDASLERIAEATSQAAEKSMIDASDDPAVRYAFYLLTQIPLAADGSDFPAALRRLGLSVSDAPDLYEIGSAFMQAVDAFSAHENRTDYGEMAQLSAVEALQSVAGRELGDLFAPDRARVQHALAGLATVKQFAVLSRDFFSRLTRRHLAFYLDRELSNHVGEGHRFTSLGEHAAFEDALDLHCREASRIIKEFAGTWFSKHVFEGGIDPGKAGRFVHVAAGKIREELRRRGSAHA
jgi:hypothetical protein